MELGVSILFTPEESGKKWVEYISLGGMKEALKKAHEEYEEGNYQWVAEFTNMIVFADPSNTEARLLCADALEQLGARYRVGNIVSSDVFYDPRSAWKKWRELGALCVEMESAALYLHAARAGKKALSFLTISDILGTEQEISPEERQKAFDTMIRAALMTAEA